MDNVTEINFSLQSSTPTSTSTTTWVEISFIPNCSSQPATPTRESLFRRKFAFNYIFIYDASKLHLNCNPNLNPHLTLNLNPTLNLYLNLN